MFFFLFYKIPYEEKILNAVQKKQQKFKICLTCFLWTLFRKCKKGGVCNLKVSQL